VDSIYFDFPGNLSTLWSHINTQIEYSSFGGRTPRYSVVSCKIISGAGLGISFVEFGFKTEFEGYLLRGRTYKIEAFYEFKEDDKIYRSPPSEPLIVVIPL
jgi:hypothetical protein